jgi:hypothetical protein
MNHHFLVGFAVIGMILVSLSACTVGGQEGDELDSISSEDSDQTTGAEETDVTSTTGTDVDTASSTDSVVDTGAGGGTGTSDTGTSTSTETGLGDTGDTGSTP